MPTSPLTDDQLRHYRALRRDGVGAATAYRVATTAQPTVPYRIGPGERITFMLDQPELAQFSVTAAWTPDPDPDTSWLGEFTARWSPDAIELSASDIRGPIRGLRYFVPAYTVAQRRVDLSARGYARGPAHLLAERGARADARLALDLDCRIATVEFRKAGVLLGAASIGTDLAAGECPDDALAAVVADHGLIDEAVEAAHATLTALAA